jgi:hypothetical protein
MTMATQNTTVGVPQSTGIGAPGTQPAPASLERSPMSANGSGQAQAIPFSRGSTLSATQDATLAAMAAGQQYQITLQTNAYLEYLILDVNIVGSNAGASTVKWGPDGPFAIFGQSGIQLTDPANQAIITPISGFKLAQMNKFFTDSGCNFDPARDANFYMLPSAANNGSGSTSATAGTANFRLVIPVELRRRDALGALTNSAANEAMHLYLQTIASYAGGTDAENNIFTTAPSAGITVNVSVWQMYWTQPPASIQSGGSAIAASPTPAGLGTLAFVRSERHNEVSGGGSPTFQLVSVGEVISNIIWTLRTTTGTNTRDVYTAGAGINQGYANWPSVFNFWVNDFQTLALGQDMFIWQVSRFYNLTNGISAQAGNPGYLDAAVFPFGPFFSSIFDKADNFAPPDQWLATQAGTKLQVRGSTFGNASSFLEVDVRTVRPKSGPTLYR